MKYGDLTLGQVEALVNVLGGMDAVRAVLAGKKKIALTEFSDEVTRLVLNPVDWSAFYQKVLGMTPDFSGLVIPKDPGGYGWPVPVAKGLTASRLFAECKKRFPCYSYVGDDLDKFVSENERTADKASYIIRVRDRAEADEELANLAANQIKKQKLTTMTLAERLLLELWYFWRTGGKHLDIKNITLCAGSRNSGGDVPRVLWVDGRLRVHWDYPDGANGSLRARSAVS